MRSRHGGRVLLFATAVLAAGIAATTACAQQPPTPTIAPAPTTVQTPAPTGVPATAAPAPAPTKPAAQPTAAASPTPLVLNNQQLTQIQPALGTVMIEYSQRMANAWFAQQAGNWDMARYQVLEMREIQEVGETTRPARASALKAFESSYLDPLAKAIDNKDNTAFTTAYNNAIGGCNSCHASQTSSEFPGSYKYIKVKVPSSKWEEIYDWKGQ